MRELSTAVIYRPRFGKEIHSEVQLCLSARLPGCCSRHQSKLICHDIIQFVCFESESSDVISRPPDRSCEIMRNLVSDALRDRSEFMQQLLDRLDVQVWKDAPFTFARSLTCWSNRLADVRLRLSGRARLEMFAFNHRRNLWRRSSDLGKNCCLVRLCCIACLVSLKHRHKSRAELLLQFILSFFSTENARSEALLTQLMLLKRWLTSPSRNSVCGSQCTVAGWVADDQVWCYDCEDNHKATVELTDWIVSEFVRGAISSPLQLLPEWFLQKLCSPLLLCFLRRYLLRHRLPHKQLCHALLIRVTDLWQ